MNIYIHFIKCYKVIHLRSPEYLADLISTHTLSRASRKCHMMTIVQRSTISAHSESAFSVVAPNTGIIYHMTLGV